MVDLRFQKEIDLWKKLGFLNHLNFSEEEGLLKPINYNARAIVLLNDGKIVLIRAENGDYHSIVGGGIEDVETIEEALIREIKEESGYDVSIISPIGYLEFWTKKFRKFDFCFLVKAIGSPSEISLTQEEINFGHEVMEVTIDEALNILKEDIKDENKVVSMRSFIELREAKNYLEINLLLETKP